MKSVTKTNGGSVASLSLLVALQQECCIRLGSCEATIPVHVDVTVKLHFIAELTNDVSALCMNVSRTGHGYKPCGHRISSAHPPGPALHAAIPACAGLSQGLHRGQVDLTGLRYAYAGPIGRSGANKEDSTGICWAHDIINLETSSLENYLGSISAPCTVPVLRIYSSEGRAAAYLWATGSRDADSLDRSQDLPLWDLSPRTAQAEREAAKQPLGAYGTRTPDILTSRI
ncbi:unnamed protein product [Diplocarpon coronariae]|nr:hypothetical protein JHW43_005612 [Diplocarpon mali]